MPAIDSVLFDMDGVLVDVSGSFRRVVEDTFAHYAGRGLPAGEVQRWKDRGGFNNDWVLTHALLADAGRDVPYDEVVAEFQRRYVGAAFDGLIATEPSLVRTETLAALYDRFGGLALVTGRPEADAHWTLRRFGWDRFFPVVVGMGQQAGREKPDPHGILLALDALADHNGTAHDPARCAYLGDTGDDMRAARAAGMRGLGVVPPYLDPVSHGATLQAAGAHAVFASPDDVLGWLEQA